ncbi:hypothetical protein K443DRAFT_43130, partial [Laccaria amethystina LaAM-08-1]
ATVKTLITHIAWWTVQAMAYQRLWVQGGRPKNWAHHSDIGLISSYFYKYLGCYAKSDPETYGFCPPRAMGYGLQIPAHQLGGQKRVWDFWGYGLSNAWVMRVSTVLISCIV